MGGLAFIGIGVGLVLGVFLTPLQNRYYEKARAKTPEGEPVPPEARLPIGCIGAILLPIGLMVFAWTCTPNVHWIVPILASVPFGTGFLLIFTSIQSYVIDCFPLYAASALAANAVQRSVLGTIFPLFSIKLYENLGLNWAGTCKSTFSPSQLGHRGMILTMSSDCILGVTVHTTPIHLYQIRTSPTSKVTLRPL